MTYETTIELAGVEISVEIEFEASYVDNGIGAYEFWGAKGVHHEWTWEINQVTGMSAIEDVRDVVRNYIVPANYASRKKYLKAFRRKVKQVERALASADASDFADDDAMIEACGDAPSNEPDCD